MDDPKVSVIMSAYNSEKHLKEAVESILTQTAKDFEFIIVDDCSTDKTPAILNEFLQRDQRIKLIRNTENIGLTRSLNKAIKGAKGKYIARMDADDIAMKQRLQKQVEFMEINPSVLLLGTSYDEVDEQGNIRGTKVFPVSDRCLRKVLIRYNPFFHASAMIRSSALKKAGLYNEDISRAQDYELWFRLAKTGKIGNLSDRLMKRRYDRENISVIHEDEQLTWAIKIRKAAIRSGFYSPLHYIYLIKPYIVFLMPFTLRKMIRKYILKSNLYG
jgi:glycosyltransferase involved in cell wall biosynthesis